MIFSQTIHWSWLEFCGQVPMVPILLHAKNQSHLMHGSRDIRETGSDDVDFLKNRVLGLAEFLWEGSYGPNTSAHAKNQNHLMHGSRDIREMVEGDYIDFLENRVLSCPEIYWVFVS
jgi:hypothetical protein